MHLTEARLAIETLVLTHSLREGTTEWEANLVASHHQLSRTPQYAEDGDVNEDGRRRMCDSTARSSRAVPISVCSASPSHSGTRPKSTDTGLRSRGRTITAMWPPSTRPSATALERDVPAAVEALRFHIETTTRLVLEARGEAAGAADSDEPEDPGGLLIPRGSQTGYSNESIQLDNAASSCRRVDPVGPPPGASRDSRFVSLGGDPKSQARQVSIGRPCFANTTKSRESLDIARFVMNNST